MSTLSLFKLRQHSRLTIWSLLCITISITFEQTEILIIKSILLQTDPPLFELTLALYGLLFCIDFRGQNTVSCNEGQIWCLLKQ